MEQIQVEYDNLINKKGAGRPNETGIENNAEYFKNYYHHSKKDTLCECGAIVLSKCMLKHLKRERHFRAMRLKQQLNSGTLIK